MKLLLALALSLLSFSSVAQGPGTKAPSVEMAPVGKVQLHPGAKADVDLYFRVAGGFHVNSNKPKSELLIPTSLRLAPTQPIEVADIKYPPGKDETFPFSPKEPLNVYSGDFGITAVLRAKPNASAGTYPVSGELKYQACDRSACYPPKSMPVQFNVVVLK